MQSGHRQTAGVAQLEQWLSYRLDVWGTVVWFQTGTWDFHLLQSVQIRPRVHQPSCLKGTGGMSPAEMQSWPENEHSSLSNAEIKNEHRYTFISPYTPTVCKGNLQLPWPHQNFTNS